MKRYVCNVFTIAMAPAGGRLDYTPITTAAARALLDSAVYESAVGHEQTAQIASAELGIPVAFARVSVRLEPGDNLVLCQYVGPRLPEGVTTLPPGAEIRWYHAVYTRP